MTDEQLDHWAEIYLANNIAHRSAGMTFEKFLVNPEGYLQALTWDMAVPLGDDEEFYPLLPEQRIVAARIAAVDSFDTYIEQMEQALLGRADIRLQGGRIIEPLRHHAYGMQRDMLRRVP